jgi:mono/diheme cytochrome c family protein
MSRAVRLVAVVTACVVARAVMMAAQSPPRTVWDGVYTDAQATRGQALYKQHCGYCHRDDLTGGGSEAGAPALKGPVFIYRWLGQPVADVFVEIGLTMPKNKPDTLTPDAVADILSFIFKSNEMPAGKSELPGEVAALEAIAMTEGPAGR